MRLEKISEVKSKAKAEHDKIKGIYEVKPNEDLFGSEHKQKLINKKEALDKKVKDMKDYSTVVRKEKIPQISEA